jgi:hypothetical protein
MNETQGQGTNWSSITPFTAPKESMVDTETGEEIDLTIVYWQRTIADRIKLKIDEFALDGAGDGYRSHLGWSVIGHSCMRYLYYHWRWFWKEQHHARMERIFLKGHQIETEMRHILKSMGAIFLDTVDTTGEQIKVSNADCGYHFGGSVDGVFVWPAIGLHVPTLLECKSTRTGSPFNDLEKKSVMVAQPRHFDQQSGYGRDLGIKYSCYIARNKNDSSIYVEIVDLDFSRAKDLTDKAKFVILNTELPKRISEKRSFHVCNMCAMQELCHDRKPPTPNCRNCKNAMPTQTGGWFCDHWKQEIPKEAIPAGCPQHNFLPW